MSGGDGSDGGLLDGRYEVRERLGGGGQGRVARAIDHQRGIDVALKFRTVATPAAREAALDEARLLLAAPPHPHMAFIRSDFFASDQHILVMDYVDGPSLSARLRASPNGLPPAEVVRWLQQVAAALDHLHAQAPPVIHGDLKPANIVIADDRAVLVDFGLATHTGRTAAGGTAAFAAPEAFRQPAPASDIYALAATAFALLTGRPPQPGAPVPPARHVFARGLASDPAARPAAASQFVEQLASALGVDTRPPAARAVPVRRALTRSALGLAVLAVAAVALTAADGPSPTKAPRSRIAARATTSVSPGAVLDGGAPDTTSPVSQPTSRRVAPGPPSSTAATAAVVAGRVAFLEPSGTLQAFSIGADGIATSGPAQAAGEPWDTVAAIGGEWVLLHRRADGKARLARFEDSGRLALGRAEPAVVGGWAFSVALGERLVFFYNDDGYASAVRYDERQRVADDDSYPDSRVSLAGFRVVASAGGPRVLLYRSSGEAVLGQVGRVGGFSVVDRSVLSGGWSVVAAARDDLLIGLGPDGSGRVLRASPTGLADLGGVRISGAPFTSAVPYRDGTVLWNRETGAAAVVHVSPEGLVTTVRPFRVTPNSTATTIR